MNYRNQNIEISWVLADTNSRIELGTENQPGRKISKILVAEIGDDHFCKQKHSFFISQSETKKKALKKLDPEW